MCRVGPLLLAACGLSTTQRAYLPLHVPGAILIVSESQSHRIRGQGEEVRRRGADPSLYGLMRSRSFSKTPKDTSFAATLFLRVLADK
jgi:hypothetical protein